ncbi:hypothetical protein BJY52DRAFT_1229052 [Lactarius psammicola]|nr:hypothetical protein BJY52DRAFT_1229052 [Lactarius psammicola]
MNVKLLLCRYQIRFVGPSLLRGYFESSTTPASRAVSVPSFILLSTPLVSLIPDLLSQSKSNLASAGQELLDAMLSLGGPSVHASAPRALWRMGRIARNRPEPNTRVVPYVPETKERQAGVKVTLMERLNGVNGEAFSSGGHQIANLVTVIEPRRPYFVATTKKRYDIGKKAVRWHQRGAGVMRVTEYNKCPHTICFIRMSGSPVLVTEPAPVFKLLGQLRSSSKRAACTAQNCGSEKNGDITWPTNLPQDTRPSACPTRSLLLEPDTIVAEKIRGTVPSRMVDLAGAS